MFEFIIGILLAWPTLIVFTLLAIFSEYHDSGWAIFFGLVIAVLSYFYFGVAFKDLLVIVPGYIIVGVLWSFWRYKRFVDKSVEREKDKHGAIDPSTLATLKAHLSPNRQLGSIVSWIIIWPISLVENLLGDIIKGVELLVTNVFKSIYRRIYESAFAGLDKK